MEGELENLVTVGWYLNLRSMESKANHPPEWQAAFALGWVMLWQDQRFCLRSEIEDVYEENLSVTAIIQQLSEQELNLICILFFPFTPEREYWHDFADSK